MPKYYRVPDSIQKQIDEMMEFDELNLEKDIENNITYESIISKHLYESNDILIDHEIALAAKRRELRLKYITGNTDEKDVNDIRLNRTEIDSTIDGNREVLVLSQKIKELENMIKYYERALQSVRNKNYSMKNILDFRKFQNGIN